jgi:hypothetical protein
MVRSTNFVTSGAKVRSLDTQQLRRAYIVASAVEQLETSTHHFNLATIQ